MTGKGKKTYVPRFACGHVQNAWVEGVEGYAVGYTPIMCVSHIQRKSFFAVNSLIACSLQVTTHDCKVDVASIQKQGAVALAFKATRYAGQFFANAREFHHT